MKQVYFLWAVLAGTALACSGPAPDASEHVGAAPVAAALAAPGQLKVMSRNVDLGADLDPIVFAQSAEEVPGLVAAAWQQMIGNDFTSRADAIAGEIARENPALVGLQEPAVFRRFTASFEPVAELDFLAMIADALTARGLDYHVAVTQEDSNVIVPMFAGFDGDGAPILDYVQMVDREAILARGDVPTSDPTADRYTVGVPLTIGGEPVEIVRGFTSLVAETDAGPFRFVSTHLEDYVSEVQLAQAAELLEILSNERLPIVAVGDFNSRADGTGTPTYGLLTRSGFTDVWARANRRDPGYGCCLGGDLHIDAAMTERLDLLLVREHGRAIKGPVSAKLLPLEKTAAGVYPSDHKALVASFRMP